jgi:hypothetical protein
MSVESTEMPFVRLLEAVTCLLNPKLPWICKVVGYLQHKRIYCLFRGIIIAVPVCSISIVRLFICGYHCLYSFSWLFDQIYHPQIILLSLEDMWLY